MFAESAGIDSEPGGCSEETHHGVSTARVGGAPCSCSQLRHGDVRRRQRDAAQL